MTRDQEIERRSARTRALAAAVPAASRAERVHVFRSAARSAAERCGCPNTTAAYQRAEDDTGWVGVVMIRPDQEWMRRQIEERGCRVVVLP